MDGWALWFTGRQGEWFEPFTDAAIREANEEVGVKIDRSRIRVVHVVHRHGEDIASQKFMDWIDVYFEADEWEGEPHNAEEHKSERLDWLDLNSLPGNIVPPQRDALEHIAKGEFYSEYGWGN